MKGEELYIKTASTTLPLYYARSSMKAGQRILSDYPKNSKLNFALKKCRKLFIYLYLKPLGDSLLFLSTVRAMMDYFSLTRPKDLPLIYAQIELKNLLGHCGLFRNAKYIKSVEKKFTELSSREIVAMITDGDPFQYFDPSYVFNTESYIYPKFIETKNERIIKEYSSRPARYYLTFEREIGVVLSGDPNDSAPVFLMSKSKQIENSLHRRFSFRFYDDAFYISLISYVGQNERQKQFGALRYIEVASLLQEKFKSKKIRFILFIHKDEEKDDWSKIKNYLKTHPCLDVVIYGGKNLEEIAYMLARMDINIGNDTGVSHLAAMCMSEATANLNPTFITYSRHDYGKWSTGKNNVIPISTKLADYLAKTGRSIKRDKIDLSKWGNSYLARSIPVSEVSERIARFIKSNKI